MFPVSMSFLNVEEFPTLRKKVATRALNNAKKGPCCVNLVWKTVAVVCLWSVNTGKHLKSLPMVAAGVSFST